MKNVSKLCLGFVTMLSLSACGKGSKTTRKEFNEKATAINKENDLKTASFSYTVTQNIGSASIKTRGSANFKKDSLNDWIITGDRNDSKIESLSNEVFNNLNLVGMLERGFYKAELDYEVMGEETFYVNPFGYETKYEATDTVDGEERTQFAYVYYEWNEYGYMTKYEVEDGYKSSSNNLSVSIKTVITVKYKK